MQKCILKWLVSVSESVSASERIRTFQLPVLNVLLLSAIDSLTLKIAAYSCNQFKNDVLADNYGKAS